MLFDLDLKFFLSGLILLPALVDDLRSRKIHNKLIIVLFAFALSSTLALGALSTWQAGGGLSALPAGVFSALFTGLLSAFLALILGVPLSLGSVIGGGDLKLLVVFALTTSWPVFIKILFFSFPWALLLGVFKIILDGKLKEFCFNIYFLFRHRQIKGLKFHTIPFSVALFMAWLTALSLHGLSL